jgi:transposase InsO family protein
VILELIEEAVVAGARRDRACEVAGLDTRTIERWRKRPDGDDLRRGPKTRPANALTADEEARIVELATAPEFVGLSPHQLVPKLADMSIFVASEASVYRVLRRRRLVRHRDRSRPRTHHRPRALVATGPNQVWAWDITYLPAGVRGTFWYLYAILDVWSRKLVGWAVHDVQSDALAAELVDAACAREGVVRDQLALHADNGGAMKGKTMLVKLEQLGVVPSFSRPRVSDDNPFPEALFRTLKYRPGYPDKPFALVEVARRWVAAFVGWYNDDHQHSGIRFVTPSQRHAGHDAALLAHRAEVYRNARQRHPGRWSRGTRNWNPITTVRLNPEHGISN